MPEEKTKKRPMLVIPDDYADVDKIGYAAHGAGLVQMVRSVKSNGSFTIGVFGEWGTGKTSMLRQIKKQLDDDPDDNGQIAITVWFNPWQFTGEEHLIIPFFHTLIAELNRFEESLKGKKGKKKIRERIGSFVRKLAYVPASLVYGLEGEFNFPYLLKAKFSAAKAMDHAKETGQKLEEIEIPETPSY